MKELELQFKGRGQVKWFIFTQIKKSEFAYIYEVNTGSNCHYEVFKRKENNHFNCISYPSNKAFGIWAYSCSTLEKALIRFEEMEVING